MFPISDWRGRVIAFGGRALEKDVPAKYLNSPETPLFHKGATLYNIAAARSRRAQCRQVRCGQSVGPRDRRRGLYRRHRHGHRRLSRRLSRRSARRSPPISCALMWRMADEPILCFDGDDAGRRAAYRALDLALPLVKPGKSLKFAALPDGQDPDDLVRSGGREAIEDVLAAPRPLADVLWTRESEAGRFETPERRAALEARLAEVTATISDETVRRYYRRGFLRPVASAVRAGRYRAAARALERPGPPPRWRRASVSAAASLRRAGLCRHQPASRREPAASRSSRVDSAPRGADPAGRAQSSVAAARPPGGIGRNRVPPRRYAKAQERADRYRRAPFRRRCRPRNAPRDRRRRGGAES